MCFFCPPNFPRSSPNTDSEPISTWFGPDKTYFRSWRFLWESAVFSANTCSPRNQCFVEDKLGKAACKTLQRSAARRLGDGLWPCVSPLQRSERLFSSPFQRCRNFLKVSANSPLNFCSHWQEAKIYTPILRERVPNNHLEGSLVYMYFPSFWYTPNLFLACWGTWVFRAENTSGVYFFSPK